MYETEEQIHNRVLEHAWEAMAILEKRGLYVGEDYLVEAVCLQGSQNYGTNHKDSDVDTKMVVTPSYKSLLSGTKFNETLILENGEHCDLKTAKDMIANICKGNINWMEGMYTQFSNNGEGTWWADVRSMREEIVGAHRLKIVSAVYGMMQQKKAHLFKPTGATQPYFDKYGFDNKNYIHIVRLHDFLLNFTETQNFQKSLYFKDRGATVMKNVLDGKVSVEEVVTTTESLLERANSYYNRVKDCWDAPTVDFQKRLEERYIEWVIWKS